jgi:hypothetical protein
MLVMTAEGSLLFSQYPVTGPYPEPDESSAHLLHHFRINNLLLYRPHINYLLVIFERGIQVNPSTALHVLYKLQQF